MTCASTCYCIASCICQQKSKALLSFHSFTGCDQTSSFASIGKKTAWEAWAIYDEVLEVFQRLSTARSISAVTDAQSLSLSATQCSCMTVQAHVQRSMLHVKTFSHAREGILHLYLQQLPPSYSMQRELHSRPVIIGESTWKSHHNFLLQASGAGNEVLPKPGNHCGQRFHRQCQELLTCGYKSERGCTARTHCTDSKTIKVLALFLAVRRVLFSIS